MRKIREVRRLYFAAALSIRGIARPTLADAILDRLVHNAYKLDPQGRVDAQAAPAVGPNRGPGLMTGVPRRCAPTDDRRRQGTAGSAEPKAVTRVRRCVRAPTRPSTAAGAPRGALWTLALPWTQRPRPPELGKPQHPTSRGIWLQFSPVLDSSRYPNLWGTPTNCLSSRTPIVTMSHIQHGHIICSPE